MKLYYSKGACSLAVRILIHELNLKSDFESVNLKTKQTESGADFLEINPKGAVPTFVTDKNEILTENAVIHQYLADTNKAYHLLPALGDFNRYHVLEGLNFVATDLHKGFSVLFNPSVTPEMRDEILIPVLKKKLGMVEKQLQKNKYLLGNDFMLPDSYLCVMLLWAEKFKISDPDWPELSRYFSDLKKRKSVQQAFNEENLML